ncbi:MAG: serine/threonine protein kinase [Myxococcaceae bacterium]|nr:serine/threonine protein kinase [Myxococcaceae bacterium]
MPQPKTFSGHRVGEYELVSRIGIGGMGIVYEGRHPIIGKRVAVKVLKAKLSQDPVFVERFVSEARAVNEARHRGIVDIFGFGQLPDGSHYFVMEYLEGQGFERIVKERAPLPATEVLLYAEQICAALHAAHTANVIHRDIKPSNLFLVDTGREPPYVKLLDFGIAKLGGGVSVTTQTGVAVGTPDYMSPEQAKGGEVSAQSDIYALGCVMFELLTGRHVFLGNNDVEVIVKHVQEAPPHVADLRPDVPAQVDQLVWWMLKKEASERPLSCELLGRACQSLRQRLEGGPAPRPSQPSLIPAPSPAPPGRTLHTPAPLPQKPATSEHALADELLAGEPVELSKPKAPKKSGGGGGLVAFGALAVLVAGGGYAWWRYGALLAAPAVEPAPLAAPEPAPVVVPAPVVAAPPTPEPVRPAPKPKRPRKVIPAGTVITKEQLFQRVFFLEKRLGATGDTDGVLLQQLSEARVAAKKAATNDERVEVARQLDEIEVLLAP